MELTPMLKMNFEQDSTAKPGEWAAFFTDVQGSVYAGRSSTPEGAVLELADRIKQVQNKSKFGQYMQRALNQPWGKWPFLEPMHPSDIPPIEQIQGIPGRDRIEHVGKIVWYTPGPDDVFQSNYTVIPGIITRSWKGGVMDMQLFTTEGTHTRHSVEHSHIPKPGTWRWPKNTK